MFTYYIWVKAHIFSIMFGLSCHSPQRPHDKSPCCNCNRFFGYEQLTFQRFSRSVIAFTMAGRQNLRSRWECFFFGVWVTHPEVQDGPLPGSDTGHHTFHATHEWGGGIKLDSQTCFGKMALFAIFLRELMHELRLVSYSGPDIEIVLNTLKKALERERLVEDKTILFSLTGL